RRDWRERALRDKLLSGEIDVHLRIMWFASAGGGALLLVLWCGGGCRGRIGDFGLCGLDAQAIGESVFRIRCKNFKSQNSEFFGWVARRRSISYWAAAGWALSHHCIAWQGRHGRGVSGG